MTFRRTWGAFLFLWLVSSHALGVDKKGEVTLEWDVIEGAESYKVEVSERKDFKKIYKTIDLSTTETSLEIPFDKTYFWRVAGKSFLGDIGEWSDPGTVHVSSPPPPPPPEPKKEPPPPPPPKIEKTKSVTKKFRPQFPAWIRGGIASYYHLENVTSSDFSVNNTGLPMGRYHLSAAITSDKLETEIRVMYQDLKFTVLNSALPQLQQELKIAQYSFSGLWRGPFRVFGFFGTLGASIKRRGVFIRDLGETLAIEPVSSVSLLAGVSSMGRLGNSSYLKWEVLAEAAPLGDWKHYGLWVETTLGYKMGGGSFTPELVLGINPALHSITAKVDSAFQCDFSASLLLKWSFGLGEKVPVTRDNRSKMPKSTTALPSPLPLDG